MTSKDRVLKINDSNIVWPGGLRVRPDGTRWSTKFKIVTIEEKPFIFKFRKVADKECNEIHPDSVDCPWSDCNFKYFKFKNAP
jgi:glutamate receptor ionotropic, NMDA 1